MKTLLLTLNLVLTSALWGLTLQVAELNTYIERGENSTLTLGFSREFYTRLITLDTGGRFGLSFAEPQGEDKVISILDAIRHCEKYGLDVLIYGQVSQQGKFLDIEVSVYDHGQRKVLKTHYFRGLQETLLELADDAALKIHAFLEQILYLDQGQRISVNEPSSLLLSGLLGYWKPLGSWEPITVPLVSAGADFSLRSGRPLWNNGEWRLFPSLGFLLDYSLTGSNAHTISYSWHSLEMGFPLALTADYQKRHEMLISLAPTSKINVLIHSPLHASPTLSLAAWWGLRLRSEYLYWFSEDRWFGAGVYLGGTWLSAEPLYASVDAGFKFSFRWEI